jgi:hypothetical protein
MPYKSIDAVTEAQRNLVNLVQTRTVGVVVENVKDLFSIPFLHSTTRR